VVNKSGVSISLKEHFLIYLSLLLIRALSAARGCHCLTVQSPVRSFCLLLISCRLPVRSFYPSLDLDLGSFECCVFGVCKARYIIVLPLS